MDYGNSIRTTHVTVANDTSSRSHAICTFIIKDDKEKEMGKLILVDLAVNYYNDSIILFFPFFLFLYNISFYEKNEGIRKSLRYII